MALSKIEWTDRSDWNPIRGCTRVSPGCGGPGEHGGCYAEAMAARFSDPGQWGHGFAERTAKGGRWTGKVEIQWDRVELPLRWKTPAKIFASSTSDFFHAALLMHDVAHLFGVMIAAHHLRGHIFQVLTKRADIMRRWLNDREFWEIANSVATQHVMDGVDPLDRRSDDARATLDDYDASNPPPGIWLGVSVEDQQRADEHIPDLLATPAAVRFISAEPLLGPVDLTALTLTTCTDKFDALQGMTWAIQSQRYGGGRLYNGASERGKVDWVIVGGESGPKARPMHPEWARSLRDQCKAAGVPFLFKQWGEFVSVSEVEGPGAHFTFPDGTTVRRVGKKAAGRLLGGREWSEFPA
jgi:protein gp37